MIGAIVQARMGSTRLPGKVMLKVGGRPVISYLFERLRLCKKLQTMILATTVNKEDDALEDFARQNNIPCFRGSADDVLSRYYDAAKKFGVIHIMRITADCPLIDPWICGRLIDKYLAEKADYVCLAPAFAEGLDCEIFSFKALEMAHRNAKKKSEREHVVLYIHNNPDRFKKVMLLNEADDSRYRFTIDEPQDFEVVKAIIDSLYKSDRPFFDAQAIKRFLDEHADIFSLNKHIIRNEGLLKSLKNDTEIR
jgi:spore coat polysaccharide biosynthesis protein SpsF